MCIELYLSGYKFNTDDSVVHACYDPALENQACTWTQNTPDHMLLHIHMLSAMEKWHKIMLYVYSCGNVM